jgi:hypothetical protein
VAILLRVEAGESMKKSEMAATIEAQAGEIERLKAELEGFYPWLGRSQGEESMNGLKRARKSNTRQDCIAKWIAGRGTNPTNEELSAFVVGFNMAWKHKPTVVLANLEHVKNVLLLAEKSKRLHELYHSMRAA